MSKPCVGCGWCCIQDPCMESHRRYGYMRRCPDLFWDDKAGRYMCGLMLDPETAEETKRSQHAGQGCYRAAQFLASGCSHRDGDDD